MGMDPNVCHKQAAAQSLSRFELQNCYFHHFMTHTNKDLRQASHQNIISLQKPYYTSFLFWNNAKLFSFLGKPDPVTGCRVTNQAWSHRVSCHFVRCKLSSIFFSILLYCKLGQQNHKTMKLIDYFTLLKFISPYLLLYYLAVVILYSCLTMTKELTLNQAHLIPTNLSTIPSEPQL